MDMIKFNNDVINIKYAEKEFLLPDPDEKLKSIYEINKLMELTGLRANSSDKSTQNPDYTELLKIFKELKKDKNLGITTMISKLINLKLIENKEYVICKIDPIPDVRLIEDFHLYLCYLYTKY
jgi:hypothetical protein